MITELDKYKDYWDKWHTLWHKNYPFDKQTHIQEWKIPKKEMGNEKKSFKYFPEPYLMALEEREIDAIFLNINPGKGGEEQVHDAKNSVLMDLYKNCNRTYSKTISGYLGKNGYVDKKNKKGEFVFDKKNNRIKEKNGTTKWFENKRLKWANNLLASEELSRLFDLIEEYNSVNSKGKLNLSNIKRLQTKLNLDKEVMDKLADFIKRRPNILCADLIPWHSNKASDIHNYIATHKKQILLKVLVPLIEMANNIKNISLKNKIFVRGVTFRNIVNNILKNNKERVTEIKHYIVFKEGGVIDEFNSLITTFNSIHTNKKSKQEIKTKWYIFTAGQSMFLPDLNYKYVVECFDNTGERKNLRTFLLEYNP